MWVHTGAGAPVQRVEAIGGEFQVGGLPAGTYGLHASPTTDDPYWHSPLKTVTVNGYTPPYTLTFRAPPNVVTGVVGTNTGIPVVSAQVVAHRLDKGGHARTLTGAGGGYRLDLSDGLWALTVKPISTTVPSHWVYPNPPQLVHFRHDPEPERKRVGFTVVAADALVSGTVELPGGGVPTFTVTVSLHDDEGIGARTVTLPILRSPARRARGCSCRWC